MAPKVFKPSLQNNLVKSFMMQPFLVFLGSTPTFILGHVCLILNTVPPQCLLVVLWMLWSVSFIPCGASPSFPSLPLTKDVFITCCALLPTKVPSFEHGWQSRRQRRNSFASPETNYWFYQRIKKPLFVALPFTPISPCLIILFCGLICLK